MLKQAYLLVQQGSLGFRNVSHVNVGDWCKPLDFLQDQWSQEQVIDQVGISHESMYCYVYADKAAGDIAITLKKRKDWWLEVEIDKVRSWLEGRSQLGRWVGYRCWGLQ